ncbi:hypothetical protein GOP47_0017449 [Adiantum capillus-veneris]|uniref:Uncharacterized protein n=1 Tax=Adiantum capillus-veneris TaxID=13818 RepID=A0A9D4UFC7_ADICA|nr:hypothetical protein GOP47_0017449 [Adiantum capillus-veneris]
MYAFENETFNLDVHNGSGGKFDGFDGCEASHASSHHLATHSYSKAFKKVNYSSITSTKAMATQNQGSGNIVVYVTVPNKDAGKELASSIINARLAACVNQVPGVESTYLWEGKVETDSEVLLIIKTRESLLQALTQHVVANHKYEVPEVVASVEGFHQSPTVV